MRLGFACHWTRPYQTSWSGTPWQLRTNLAERTDLVSLGTELPEVTRHALRVLGLRRTATGMQSMWRQHPVTQELVARRLRAAAAADRPDVILEIQDLTAFEQPFMVVQDLNYRLLVDRFGRDGVPHFRSLSRSRVSALLDRQERIYASSAMLLPMSNWLADSLRRSGIPESRITVVNPGVNAGADVRVAPRRQGPTSKLLFVGRDFDTKAGSQVVQAFKRLRADIGPGITLTIAGPSSWPLPGEVPPGVDFRGRVPAATVGDLMDSHDLFVMPSLFEGFGIVFAEALIRGLPCIARDDCAMPEIVDRESGGRLVTSESPEELADAILDALQDDDLYRRCADRATERRQHYTWSRAADQIAAAAKTVVSR